MGPHILGSGWLLNNSTTAPSVQFWEYKSKDLNGAPTDVSQRAAFSRQLTDAEARQWSDPVFVLGWSPYTVNGSVSSSAVQVNWSAAARHSAKDWIGLYAAGASDAAYLDFKYAGASHTGKTSFTLPARPGEYELRVFENDGFTRRAVSNRITVR
jgi:hypothetical protein